MGRVVRITEKEYQAIMQWEEDGGNTNIDITYEIIPDPLCDSCDQTLKPDNVEEEAPCDLFVEQALV